MLKPTEEKEATASKPVMNWVIGILLLLVVYQVYSGIALKKVGIPGIFEVDFADKAAAPLPTPAPLPAPVPEISRDFIIGRWQVEQSFGQVSGGTETEYLADGTLSGTTTMFNGGMGQKQAVTGQWNFAKVTPSTFRLYLQMDNQPPWTGTFKIIDQNHIQNIDQNYVAVRM